EGVVGVLAEVVRRVDQDAVGAHARLDGAVGEAADGVDDVGDHVGVGGPVRAGAGGQAAGVRADQGGAGGGGHLGERRVGAGPGVVEQVRAGRDGPFRDAGPPGVDGDHQVRVAVPDQADERDDPANLLRLVDRRAGSGLDAADVHQVGALLDR